MNRALALAIVIVAATSAVAASAEETTKATLYKSPQCGCCEEYADYLRGNGFEVTVKPTNDLATISDKAGVPEQLAGCHTMFVDGYVVAGHVPAAIVRRLLSERPSIAGITLPGMPAGSPGMSGMKTEPFVIYALPNKGGEPKIYASE